MARSVFSRPRFAQPTFRRPINEARFTRPTSRLRYGVARIVRDNYGPEWDEFSQEILKRDNYQCVFCKAKTKLRTHHLKELSHGGKTTSANCATICEDCHKKRHAHLR